MNLWYCLWPALLLVQVFACAKAQQTNSEHTDWPEKVASFKDWFEANNSIQEPSLIDIVSNDNHVFLQSKQALAPGQIYAKVSQNLIVDIDTVTNHPVLGSVLVYVEDRFGALSPIARLQVWLLFEKYVASQSDWAPYLHLMPTANEVAMPLFLSTNQSKVLHGTPLHTEFATYRQEVLNEFSTLQANLFDLYEDIFENQISLKRFFWSRAILDRYAHWSGNLPYLNPLADFIGWNVQANTQHTETLADVWTMSDDGRFAVARTQSEVAPGEAMTEYLAKPDHWLLKHKGSIPPTNPHACFLMALTIPKSDPDRDKKLLTLRETFNSTTLCVSSSDLSPLLSYVRIRLQGEGGDERHLATAATEFLLKKKKAYEVNSQDSDSLAEADSDTRQLLAYRHAQTHQLEMMIEHLKKTPETDNAAKQKREEL